MDHHIEGRRFLRSRRAAALRRLCADGTCIVGHTLVAGRGHTGG